MITRFLLFYLVSFFVNFHSFADELLAKHNIYKNNHGQTVLSVNLTYNSSSSAFGTSDLLEPNYPYYVHFVSKSVSQRTSIVNGDASYSTNWKMNYLVDLDDVDQELALGSYYVDGLESNPITVSSEEINSLKSGLKNKSASKNSKKDFFIEVSLSSKEVFLGQSLPLTIKVYLSKNLSDSSLSYPKSKGFLLENIDKEDSYYDKLINGVNYRVIEKSYIITPNKSGKLHIDSFVLTGVANSISSLFFFSGSNTSRAVSIKSDPVDLSVKDIGASSGNTIVASGLKIIDFISKKSIELGSSVVRKIKIVSENSDLSYINALDLNLGSNARVYNETPVVSKKIQDNNVVFTKEFSYAVVPSKEGVFSFPKLEISWFNTLTNKTESYFVAQKSFNVSPSFKQPVAQPLAPPQNNAANNNSFSIDSSWVYVAVLFAALWFLTLLFIAVFLYQKKSGKNFSFGGIKKISFKNKDLFQKYCSESNAKGIITELPNWFSMKTGVSFNSVAEIIEMYPSIKKDLEHLQRICYSPKTGNEFDANSFYKRCLNCLNQKQVSEKNSLEDLYPN